MLVHFASGTHPFAAPWWNVDIENSPGTNQVADLLDPLPSNLREIETAYVGHFLEHLTHDECVKFLVDVRERMIEGGRLVVVGPDAVKGQEHFNRGLIPESLLQAIKAHGSIPEDDPHNRGNVHVWDCTGSAVVGLLQQSGWQNAQEFPVHRMARFAPGVPLIDSGTWQFAVVATAE